MVAPSEKNAPRIVTRSFAREDAKMTPSKSNRIMSDRRSAEVWSVASEAVSERFDILARLAMAAAWYQALSADETRYWLSYFCDDVTVEGVAVRRIPRGVTEALAAASKRGCFDGYFVKANLEQQQYVLIGLLDDGETVRHYPIIAWYPPKSPIPTRQELKEIYEVQVATTEQQLAAEQKRRQEAARLAQEQQRQLRRSIRQYWGIAAAPLVAINLVLLIATSVRWAFCSFLVSLVGGWLVWEVNDRHDTPTSVRRRLAISLCALVGGVGGVLLVALLL